MTKIEAEIAATVWKVLVNEGDEVTPETDVVILESMKMEIPVTAPRAGRVAAVHVAPDDKVTEGQVLVVLEVDQG
jgi:acetyl-CoA carboxylase biotin carboxyl carrier protein